MISIFLKEVNEFLDSLIAYLVMGVFLTGIGLLIWVFPDTNVLDYGYATLETLFSLGPYILMFLIPAITMKSFAEEKKTGTLELLKTLPFRTSDVVLGKFFAGFILVIISLLPTIIYYYTIYELGNPEGNLDTPGILGSYVGLMLLGGVFCSIGIFASSITHNQIVAFVLAAFLSFIFYSGFDALAGILGDATIWIENLGIVAHYVSLSRGVIDMVDVTYFLGVIAFFLVITVQIVDKK